MTDGLHTDHRRETFHAMARSHPVYGGEAWAHAVATIVIGPAHKQRFARGAVGLARTAHRPAPLAHLLWMLVESPLYCLENMLMLPTADPPLLARGATVLDGAALASIGRVAAQNQSIFLWL
jgi:hypothetical protein